MMKYQIVCYGDSNTWGYDPRGFFAGRYYKPWPELLAEKSGWTVLNQGENGREIPRNLPDIPRNTDLLVIMLGTNDLLQFWTPEAACEKMENFLRSLPLPGAKILLIAPPAMQFGDWVLDQELIEDSLALARGYSALSQRLGIRFADSGGWNIPLAFDGVHMTHEGHIAFAEKLYKYLTKGE